MRSSTGPLQALAALSGAPRLACLIGERQAVVAWSWDTGPVGTELREPARGALAAEAGWGRSWGLPPPGAALALLPYDWPSAPAACFQPEAVLVWDTGFPIARDAAAAALLAQLQRAGRQTPLPLLPRCLVPPGPRWTAAEHAERVAAVQQLIRAGDCYQVNIGVPFSAQLAPGPSRDLAVFAALVAQSPAPYAGFLRLPGRPSFISHSPECLLAARGVRLCSAPIKGTRRREAGCEAALAAELASSAKDGAELAMIVDMARNDLGRVARPGSVRVAERAAIMSLPYVLHRVARVEAELAPERGLLAAIAALHPAASITGAPKHRVRQIIAALEDGGRGAWCGSFGWLASGGCDLAVAIRSCELDGDQLYWRAGGGIVADSQAAAEWAEVLAKAAPLCTLLEESADHAVGTDHVA